MRKNRKPRPSNRLNYNLTVNKYNWLFKNYSIGVKLPVSISKLPLPYLSDKYGNGSIDLNSGTFTPSK